MFYLFDDAIAMEGFFDADKKNLFLCICDPVGKQNNQKFYIFFIPLVSPYFKKNLAIAFDCHFKKKEIPRYVSLKN